MRTMFFILLFGALALVAIADTNVTGIAAFAATGVLALTRTGDAGSPKLPRAPLSETGPLRLPATAGPWRSALTSSSTQLGIPATSVMSRERTRARMASNFASDSDMSEISAPGS